MKHLRLALSVTAITLTVFSAAMATPPVRTTSETDIDWILGDCDGFVALRQAHYTILQTSFFDNSGVMTHFTQLWTGTETFINSVTGRSIEGIGFHGLQLITVDPENEELWLEQLTRGYFLGGVVPGVGSVLLNSGNITWDLTTWEITFRHGNFDLPGLADEADLSKLCEVLSDSSKPNRQEPTWGHVKRLYQ